MKQKPQAKRLLEDLADGALMRRFTTDGVREFEKPGFIVQNLSPEQRQILKSLKSEDVQDVRWPRPDGFNLEKMPRRLR